MRNYKKSKKKIQIGFINLAFLLSAKIIPAQLSKVLNQSILCSVFNPCLLFEKEKKEHYINQNIKSFLFNCLDTEDRTSFNLLVFKIKVMIKYLNDLTSNQIKSINKSDNKAILNDSESNPIVDFVNSEFKISRITEEKHQDNSEILAVNNYSDNTSFGLSNESSNSNIRNSLKNNKLKDIFKKGKNNVIEYKPKYEKLGVQFKKQTILKNSEKLIPVNEAVNSTKLLNSQLQDNTTITKNNIYPPSEYRYVYDNATTKKLSYIDIMMKNKLLKITGNTHKLKKSPSKEKKSNAKTIEKPSNIIEDKSKLKGKLEKRVSKNHSNTNININIKELNIISNNKKSNEDKIGNKPKNTIVVNKDKRSEKLDPKTDKKSININLNIANLNKINSKSETPEDILDTLNDSDTNIDNITATRKEAYTPAFDHKLQSISPEFNERATSAFGTKRNIENNFLYNDRGSLQFNEDRFSFQNCIGSELNTMNNNTDLFNNIDAKVIKNKLNFNINDDFDNENLDGFDLKNNENLIYMLNKNKNLFENDGNQEYSDDDNDLNDSFANKEITFIENFRPDSKNIKK